MCVHDPLSLVHVRAERDHLEASCQRLTQVNVELRAAQRDTENIVQLIVHDLRNPLSVVLTHIDLVLQAIATIPGLVQAHADLTLASSEAQRLAGMVNDLLVIAKLEGNHLRAKPAPTVVQDLLDAVARAFAADASAKGVRLEVVVTHDLTANIDACLVRRLVDNLVHNALRHTRAGDAIQVSGALQGASLRIGVDNSGPPVSHATRARLFQKFGGEDGDRGGTSASGSTCAGSLPRRTAAPSRSWTAPSGASRSRPCCHSDVLSYPRRHPRDPCRPARRMHPTAWLTVSVAALPGPRHGMGSRG